MMILPKFFFCLLVAVAFSSCVSPAVKPYVGQYNSGSGDFLIIKRDGTLHWSPVAKDSSKLRYTGVLAMSSVNKTEIMIIAASASPWVGAKLRFSADFNTVEVDWGYPGVAAEKNNWGIPAHRSVRFVRSSH